MSRKLLAAALGTVAMVTGFGAGQAAKPEKDAAAAAKTKSFYSFKTTGLDGKPVDLSQYKGKVTLVVNVASRCGFTPQYGDLEKLSNEFKDKGLVVIGFPCNDFGGQEPGTSDEIKQFCSKEYSVTFPIMQKVQVKAGAGQNEIYAYLAQCTGMLPSWNFGKYLIGRDGKPIAFFASNVKPRGDELKKAIEKALAEKPVS